MFVVRQGGKKPVKSAAVESKPPETLSSSETGERILSECYVVSL